MKRYPAGHGPGWAMTEVTTMQNPAMLYGATLYRRDAAPGSTRAWLKRAGVAGFGFFLAKGLAWLLVPGLVAYYA